MEAEEEIRMTLNIIKMEKFKAKIILKSKRFEPVIAKVKSFEYKGGETKITLKRCEETIFPNDTDDNKQEEYVMLLKDIKHADKYD